MNLSFILCLGKGRAMMIVNVNQLASTFDETLHAIKFSAIAKEVVILTQPEPPPKEIKEKSRFNANLLQCRQWLLHRNDVPLTILSSNHFLFLFSLEIMGPPAPPPNKNNVVKGKTSIAAKPGGAKSGTVSSSAATDSGAKSGAASSSAAANKNVKGVKASTSAKETIDLNVTTSSETSDGSCRCKDVPSEYFTIEQVTRVCDVMSLLFVVCERPRNLNNFKQT